MNSLGYLCISLLMLTVSVFTWAEPRIDYDVDDDGLIEINDLQDLNEIRNNFVVLDKENSINLIKGYTLYKVNDGCPEDGCSGYELVGDLDFDSNKNGEFDEGDMFWNEGKGWQPIGGESLRLSAEFNGNGHTLHNLTIRRPDERFIGLFSYSDGAKLHDFSLTANMVTGNDSGAVLGFAVNSSFSMIQVEVVIKGECEESGCKVYDKPSYIGGMLGFVDNCDLKQLVIKAQASGGWYVGGLAGFLYYSDLNEIAVKAEVEGTFIGGVATNAGDSTIDSVVVFVQMNGDRRDVGGLLARGADTQVTNILISGNLDTTGDSLVGGLMGQVHESEVSNVVNLVRLPNLKDESVHLGALIGSASTSTHIDQAYFATDLALTNYYFPEYAQINPSQNYDLVDLQCASGSKNCNGLVFDAFGDVKNSENNNLWSFGTEQEAPTMVLPMGEFGDKDGDGQADSWPIIEGPSVDRNTIDSPNDNDSSNSSGSLYFLLLLIPMLWRRESFQVH